MFAWTDRELNREQEDAIREEGSLLLTACPGSGKTRTLTYKAAYELSRLESDRQFVVAITYTHRAADEIQERIEDLGVDTERLWIGTIHSFCLEWILKPYSIYQPALGFGYRIIDQHEREQLLERLCLPYAAERVTTFDCDYYFTQDGYRLGCPNPTKHQSIHRILAEYFRTLEANRQIDFELLLWHACALIERIPEISRLLSKMFSMVLVDEYQDTKQIQYSIIGSILRAGEGGTRLFMVGDPNQGIYGSLGGYPIGLEELRQLTNLEIQPKELSGNYRSSARIVQYFGNFNVYNTRINPVGEDRDYPSLISYDTRVPRDGLVDEIARLVRHNIEGLGVLPHEVCVLAPQWAHLATMTRGLAVAMPEYHFNGPGMVPFARDPENFWYKLSRIALSDPSPGMYTRRLRWTEELLRDLQQQGVNVSNLSAKAILRTSNAIVIPGQDGLAFLRQYFEMLFLHLGIAFAEIDQLREHHVAFFEGAERRIARIRNEGVTGVGDLEFFKRAFQNRDGITVSTIHGVKGAEFDVVLAFALLEGMVPHFNDQDGADSARKLLYVVGSRAKKNLHLFSETGRPRGRRDFYAPTNVLTACNYAYDAV